MNRVHVFAAATATVLLASCGGTPPAPEYGANPTVP